LNILPALIKGFRKPLSQEPITKTEFLKNIFIKTCYFRFLGAVLYESNQKGKASLEKES